MAVRASGCWQSLHGHSMSRMVLYSSDVSYSSLYTLTCVRGCPACAGMAPIPSKAMPIYSGLPRLRGDGPWTDEEKDLNNKVAPPTRGWPYAHWHCLSGPVGCPAYAGDGLLFGIDKTGVLGEARRETRVLPPESHGRPVVANVSRPASKSMCCHDKPKNPRAGRFGTGVFFKTALVKKLFSN